MSYPSVDMHLNNMGVTVDTATEAQLSAALLQAFETDLPLGMARVEELVAKLDEEGKDRVIISLDPKSVEGQQYARLLGPDIPRQVLEGHFGVKFGIYNCCGGVAGRKDDDLQMTLREQIEAQHPNFVDC